MTNNSQFTGMQPPRPPIVGPPVPQNGLPSMSMQFRPAVPPQQPQPFIPVAPQQFQPIGHTNIGIPPAPPQIQFPQPVPQLPSRPNVAGHGPPQGQVPAVPDFQLNRPSIVPAQQQQNGQISNSYMPGFGGPIMPISTSYNLSASSGGPQISVDSGTPTQYQPMLLANAPGFSGGGQPWVSTGNQSMNPVTPAQQAPQQNEKISNLEPVEKVPSDWIEHTNRQGKKYYYNRRTKLSYWQKPLELMTAIERADASTDWREVTSPEGRKFYHNKVTGQSKWIIPDEVKLARERANMDPVKGVFSEKSLNCHIGSTASLSKPKASPPPADGTDFIANRAVTSPVLVAPVANDPATVSSGMLGLPMEASTMSSDVSTVKVEIPVEPVTSVVAVSDRIKISSASATTVTTPTTSSDTTSAQDAANGGDGVSPENPEDSKGAGTAGSTISEGRPPVYESKLEAKSAFIALLETANIGSDWTWEQAMRVIINDRRYGALRSLGERKQTFNEFLGQKKKQEAEERRARQKRARQDFKKMLEESKELTSSTRWSKAISIFEDDERFKAVERAKDREDLFEDFIDEMMKKEKAKAAEEHKRNRVEYLEFLKSCDFIKASSQWRKVQDRLEADERCSRLEKFDRLEIFQEYIRDLEKEEEENRKLRMEELRKAERKNRDEFRKMMEEHVAEGVLTAKTHWRDYCMKVKDTPAYLAVSSNTSGSTAKDLFEDVSEELDKQYLDDKALLKDALKMGKMTVLTTWNFDDFKAAISKDSSLPPVSAINIKLVFEELLERAQEKEEKEAKKRKRLADDFYELLHASKEITATSRWEECRPLFEDRFVGEERLFEETFDRFITELREKAKEKERKRKEDKAWKDKERKEREKKKERQRKDKERGDESRKHKERPKKGGSDSDGTESISMEDRKGSGRVKDKKHRKRHATSMDNSSLDEGERDRSKSSRHRSVERKKSKQMEHSEADSESQYRRHKRESRNGSHRNYGDKKEQRDGEFDEAGNGASPE